VLSLATLALRDDINGRLKSETQRLAALLTLAGQEAVLQSSEMAVVFTPQTYRFQVLEENKWVDVKDPMFRERQLAEDMSLFIEVEGEAAQQPAQDEKQEENPRVYLLSSGEMTPFTLTLKHKNSTASYQLRSDFSGEFTFGP
jgi:general secretion pathway protein H